MVSIFTTKASVEDFYNQDNAWYKMICKLNEVYVDDDPFSDCDYENPDDDVFLILAGMGVKLIDEKKDFINNIPKDPKSVLRYPCGIFLLDISEAKAKTIQEDYGVICQSTKNLDCTPLIQPNFPNELEEGETDRTWSAMLSNFKSLPSNSALIIDAHLFQQDRYDENTNSYDERDSKGINNLCDILDAILPEYFCDTYHVCVMLTDYDIANKSSAQKNLTNKRIANAINKLKSKLDRAYDISIEVVFVDKNDNGAHSLIHNRRILSNYYLVTADYALAALNRGRALRSQSIIAFPLFENIQEQPDSDKKEKRQRSDLKKLSEMLKSMSSSLVFYQNGREMPDFSAMRHRMLTFS